MTNINASNRVELDDEENFINQKETVDKIIQEIKDCKDLEHLSLQGNALTLEQIKKIADVLINKKTLKSLNIGYNNKDKDNSEEYFRIIKKIILDHPSLEYLSLECNGITTDDVKLLLNNDNDVKDRLKCIKLNLACNRIDDDGLKLASSHLSIDAIASIITSNSVKDEELKKQCYEQVKLASVQSESLKHKGHEAAAAASPSFMPAFSSNTAQVASAESKTNNDGKRKIAEIIPELVNLSDEEYAEVIKKVAKAREDKKQKNNPPAIISH